MVRDEGKEKNHIKKNHIKKSLKRCGYPGWEEEQEHPRERWSAVIPYSRNSQTTVSCLNPTACSDSVWFTLRTKHPDSSVPHGGAVGVPVSAVVLLIQQRCCHWHSQWAVLFDWNWHTQRGNNRGVCVPNCCYAKRHHMLKNTTVCLFWVCSGFQFIVSLFRLTTGQKIIWRMNIWRPTDVGAETCSSPS